MAGKMNMKTAEEYAEEIKREFLNECPKRLAEGRETCRKITAALEDSRLEEACPSLKERIREEPLEVHVSYPEFRDPNRLGVRLNILLWAKSCLNEIPGFARTKFYAGLLKLGLTDCWRMLRGTNFSFKDFVHLDDDAIRKVLANVDQQELAKALKGKEPWMDSVREKFFRNMPERTATMLKEDMEFMGPVRAEDCHESRGRILYALFRLEDEGGLSVDRSKVDWHEIFRRESEESKKKAEICWWWDSPLDSKALESDTDLEEHAEKLKQNFLAACEKARAVRGSFLDLIVECCPVGFSPSLGDLSRDDYILDSIPGELYHVLSRGLAAARVDCAHIGGWIWDMPSDVPFSVLNGFFFRLGTCGLSDLADELRERFRVYRVSFMDMLLLDDRAIGKVVKECSLQDIVTALRCGTLRNPGMPDMEFQEDWVPSLMDKILSNMSGEEETKLKDLIVAAGPASEDDVVQARGRIVQVLHRLEDEGNIVIARSGDDEMID